MIPISIEILELIISELKGRKGFSGWWDGIDEEIKDDLEDELFHKIVELLQNSPLTEK